MHKKPDIRLTRVQLMSIAIDLLTIALTFTVLMLLRKATGGTFPPIKYYRLWPFLFLFWLVFEKAGLYQGASVYSGASIGPVEEFRRIFYALTGIFIALGFSNYVYRPNDYLYSRSILLATWAACLIFIPTHRLILRKLCTRLGIWGVPAVLIGSGKTAKNIAKKLTEHTEYGLRLIGFFNKSTEGVPNLPFLGTLSDIPAFAKKKSIQYAIIAHDEADMDSMGGLVKKYGDLFPHVLFIPKPIAQSSVWITPRDLGGMLGLEVRHNLQIPHTYLTKRCIDFLLTLPCLLIGSVLMGIIALLIKLDSPGPVFFRHQRIGKNRKPMTIYKFRTMTRDADEQLSDLLAEHSDLQAEWETYGKLEHDPRITRIGRWLRATSLDELPQLFNVLQGKLALVGPRPVVKEELAYYGDDRDLFDRVMPGLTGLWQVSGRNHLSYEDRVRLDNYYANNWSVWLDLYILSKTFYAVLFRHGAR